MHASASARDLAAVAALLRERTRAEIRADYPLAPHTSYGIGGPTALWVAPQRETDLPPILRAVREAGLPLFVLGRGSNVLVSDRGWPGVTLHVGEAVGGMHFAGLEVEAQAGCALHRLVLAAAERGLAGLEPLAGIPGGVGGALQMNAGAFGREIADLVVAVRGFTLEGEPFEAGRSRLSFGYRASPGLEGILIAAARLRLEPGPCDLLRRRVAEVLEMRARRQPLEFPSCGSVFKRPAGYYAGALIEEAGLKGERVGGAQVSPKHAGFIVNRGGATASDVYRLIRRIEERVFERFGVRLEREVRLVGDFDETP
ncbi:MAG: UDP-N-acetylmuramate dehydrogenase [Desulfobacterales bacterium]